MVEHDSPSGGAATRRFCPENAYLRGQFGRHVDVDRAVAFLEGAMTNNDGAEAADVRARENRRWLIGIGISLFFGIFASVMAFLSYAERNKIWPASVSGPGAAQPAAPATPAPRGDRKVRHRD